MFINAFALQAPPHSTVSWDLSLTSCCYSHGPHTSPDLTKRTENIPPGIFLVYAQNRRHGWKIKPPTRNVWRKHLDQLLCEVPLCLPWAVGNPGCSEEQHPPGRYLEKTCRVPEEPDGRHQKKGKQCFKTQRQMDKQFVGTTGATMACLQTILCILSLHLRAPFNQKLSKIICCSTILSQPASLPSPLLSHNSLPYFFTAARKQIRYFLPSQKLLHKEL